MRLFASPMVALALLAGCAEKLPTRALTAFATHEAWCAQLKGAKCKGEWPDAKPGTSPLGAYRFVVIDAAPIENFGGGPSVSFELQTKRGFVYEPMGAIGSTGRSGNTTMNVEGITPHAGVLDVRTHARMISGEGMSDTQEAVLFIEGSSGVGVAHVHLGSNTRDELGRSKGRFGELTWKDNTLVSRSTSLKDGEYRLAAP
jgi:hypothetical protein